MRGFLAPAIRNVPNDLQNTFCECSRGRQGKLAEQAHTTLVKANAWARGEKVAPEVAEALEAALKAHAAKKK